MVGREEAKAGSASVPCPGCVIPDGLPAAPGILLPDGTKSSRGSVGHGRDPLGHLQLLRDEGRLVERGLPKTSV